MKKKNYRTRYHRAREPKTVYALSAAPRTATGATTRQLRHRGAARPRCRSWKKPEAFRQTPTAAVTAAASTVGMRYNNMYARTLVITQYYYDVCAVLAIMRYHYLLLSVFRC